MKKAFIVTDLGPGDGGKGGVVHKLAIEHNAHTIIKVGGAQCGHGVKNSEGNSMIFSHFGCGTLEGKRTHLSYLMNMEPFTLNIEADELKKIGIANPYDLITCDENVLVITPYHTYSSRLRELSLGENPRGTVGTGGGDVHRHKEKYPDEAIYARDLRSSDVLRRKLEVIRKRKQQELHDILEMIPDMSGDDRLKAEKMKDQLFSEHVFENTLNEFGFLADNMQITDDVHFKNLLKRDGNVVVECSHGILTDRHNGFHPHTTYLRTMPGFVVQMLQNAGYDGEIVRYGIFRAYSIRHGAGPFVTNDPKMLEQLLPGSNKGDNRWQGKVRVGALDMVMLKYAIDACGGAENFDALAVTWFDQVQTNGRWDICTAYEGSDRSSFFDHNGDVIVKRNEDDARLEYQRKLGEKLYRLSPQVMSHKVTGNQEENISLVKKIIEENLRIPLKMISVGPTEKDKIIL